MGKINILNDADTNKLTLEFNGTSDSTLNAEHFVGIVGSIQGQLDNKADATVGSSPSNPAENAMQIKMLTGTHTDGLYWIKVNGVPTQVYCDMNTAGGGWMLFASKTTPTFIPINGTFNNDCMSVVGDKHGYIPASFIGSWSQLLWRFQDKENKPYAAMYSIHEDREVDSKKIMMGLSEGDTTYNASDFNSSGYRVSTNINAECTWSPQKTMYSANSAGQHYVSTSGISMNHSGSDKVLDMWNSVDSTHNYYFCDSTNAMGTKCVAGYCYLNEPVMWMFR